MTFIVLVLELGYMAHELPKLPYDYGALEPSVDTQTMQIHHGKHHQAYIDKLNDALKDLPELLDKPLDELLKNLTQVPEEKRTAVRNNGGGHWNHSKFWNWMRAPQENNAPSQKLAEAINTQLGGFDKFKEDFTNAGVGRFGSGWVWLIVKDKKLAITSTPNQDNPLMDNNGSPILGLDVWEHAYYLKYQNRRPEYISAWFDVINWKQVESDFEALV